MKKMGLFLVLPFLLLGCASQTTFETIADEIIAPVAGQPEQVTVQLPETAVSPVLDSGSRQLYLCEDYEIVIETIPAGDLQQTITDITGFDRDRLTVVQRKDGDADRYEFVWVTSGETGEQLGRCVILDDGNYYHCMSVLREAYSKQSTQIVWNDVFDSFRMV